MQQKIQIGDQIQINIKKLGINGEGIGYLERLAIFVDGCLPGEDVLIEITEVHDNRAVGKLVDVIHKTKERTTPFCPVYDRCGGCQIQHIDYESGLKHKRDLLVQAFRRYIDSKYPEKKIKDTIGSENPLKYRNKASLPVERIKGINYLGMYAKNSNQFIIIESCPIQNDLINKIMIKIIELSNTLKIHAYNAKIKRGYLKFLIVRTNAEETEAQVTYILNDRSNRLDKLTELLVSEIKEVKSVFSVLADKKQKIGFFTENQTLLYGNETITTQLGGYTFSLKPGAFFQLNHPQAKNFYETMVAMADLCGHEVAIDAYSGIAPVSHYIHKRVKEVYAIEIDRDACASARLSIQKNGITNVKILESDFKRALSGLKDKKIHVMFFDPPRVGLGDETIDLIFEHLPEKLIYGSCNPSTLAKDLKRLSLHYDINQTIPLDMFPFTAHVESVTRLTKRKNG